MCQCIRQLVFEQVRGVAKFVSHHARFSSELIIGGDRFATQRYMEGPSLFKHAGFWFACGSYGSMGRSYTIRCGRARVSHAYPLLHAKGTVACAAAAIDSLVTCTHSHAFAASETTSMLITINDGEPFDPGFHSLPAALYPWVLMSREGDSVALVSLEKLGDSAEGS